MKLLLDQNLSRRMLRPLEQVFPGSSHVAVLGLDQATDNLIWNHAKEGGFAIVTLDSDFHELAMLYGAPPKVIWLKCGNRPRWYIERLLLTYKRRIAAFEQEDNGAVLELY